MLKKLYSLLLISLVFATTTTLFAFADTHTNNINKGYVVGYDVSMKEEIFGDISDEQISQILAENISELRKADELGNLYIKAKNIENKGLFFFVLDDTVLGKEFKIVNDNENLTTVGDVRYGGSFVYMVELHFLDAGWVKD